MLASFTIHTRPHTRNGRCSFFLLLLYSFPFLGGCSCGVVGKKRKLLPLPTYAIRCEILMQFLHWCRATNANFIMDSHPNWKLWIQSQATQSRTPTQLPHLLPLIRREFISGHYKYTPLDSLENMECMGFPPFSFKLN